MQRAHKILAGLAMAATWAGAATAATVAVTGPATGTPGGTVTVAVSLSPNLSNVYALQGALSYDAGVLTPLPSQEPGAPQGFYQGSEAPFPGESIPKDADLFRMNATQAGQVIFGYVKNPTNPPGSTSATVPANALQITFSVASGVTGETQVRLAGYTVNGQALPPVLLGDINGAPIAATVGDALTIQFGSVRRPGDANKDGAVTVEDVLQILQAAGGVAVVSDTANADVWPAGAPDGAVTLEDALRVSRFLNGLETSLD